MGKKLNVILLSGGSGKRLWPLSNDIRSKQFIKIFKNGDCYESMVQRVFRQIKTINSNAVVTVATSKTQVSSLHNQIGEEINISIEPCRRDTFPAIALAVAYLHDVVGLADSDTAVVCPVDPYVGNEYFQCLQNMCDSADAGSSNLVLMGIEPTYPSEKYGYIRSTTDDGLNYYFTFTEKPNEEKAREYIRQGALWNGGVFAFKLSYVLKKSKELLGSADYRYLFDHYNTLTKISFDYAVVEKERSIEVIRYSGFWKDLGTWNTLTEAMDENVIGKATVSDTCKNVHIINELDVPIIAMGLQDVVVSASPEGILVSDKQQSSFIKPYVDAIDQQIMFAEKSWGSFKVVDVENDSLIIKITLNAGHHMNYHSHDRRDEIWTVISGSGITVVDGKQKAITVGNVIIMKAGQKHTVKASDKGLQMIETQIGKEINVSDKHKYEMEDPFR